MSEANLKMSAASLIIVQKYQGVFKDFTARRAGIVRALTTDVDRFYELCDPEKENLCLYGLPDESWEVSLPVEEVPPLLPEPVRGINFARDGMTKKDWIFLVAVHSDCWLLSVALYLGARLHPNDRKRLLCLIYDLPTIFEVVSEGKPMEGSKPSVESGSESGVRTKGDALCGTCGVRDRTGEFLWYHGKCVKAKTVEQYKCPSCKLQESKQAVV